MRTLHGYIRGLVIAWVTLLANFCGIGKRYAMASDARFQNLLLQTSNTPNLPACRVEFLTQTSPSGKESLMIHLTTDSLDYFFLRAKAHLRGYYPGCVIYDSNLGVFADGSSWKEVEMLVPTFGGAVSAVPVLMKRPAVQVKA